MVPSFTHEQKLESRRNREKAAKYFNLEKGYCLHHIDTELRYNNIERYIQWNPEDLVVMTRGEHSTWHHYNTPLDYSAISEKLKGRTLTEEHRKKIGLSQIGRIVSEETREKIASKNRGRKMTDEQKKKMSHHQKKRKVIEVNSGEIFESTLDARNKYGSTVTNQLYYNRKKSNDGLQFMFLDDYYKSGTVIID